MIFKRDDEADDAAEAPTAPAPERREGTKMTDSEVTIVGAAAKLEGTVVSAGTLRIDGQVKGQIQADGDVTLSPQSQVEADIRAQNVSVAGRFKGNVVVKGKAHLARGGRIEGNITSKTLVVEEGGIFHGQSLMDGAASTTAQAAQPATQQPGAAGQGERPTPQVKVP